MRVDESGEIFRLKWSFVAVLLVIDLYYIMITCISDILLLNRDVYR